MPICLGSTSVDDHAYSAPKAGDKRAPCPGLNAMANHGFIPRDGRDLGFFALVGAMREVYNLSLPLAAILAIAGLLLCGHWKGFRRVLDLDALAAHNKIEHDASLAHLDAKAGDTRAPILVDQGLVHKLSGYAGPKDSSLGLADFARARHDREAILTKPLDGLHEEIAGAEAVLALLVFQDESGKVPQKRIEEWFGKEMLPEGWSRPLKTIGFFQTRGVVKQLKEAMKMIPPAPPSVLVDNRFGRTPTVKS